MVTAHQVARQLGIEVDFVDEVTAGLAARRNVRDRRGRRVVLLQAPWVQRHAAWLKTLFEAFKVWEAMPAA
jgi:hypothetical protein